MTERCAIVNDSIAPNAYIRPRKSAWPGQDRQDRDAAEDEDADPRRAEARVQLAQRVGQLAVDAHRVDEPRDADERRRWWR